MTLTDKSQIPLITLILVGAQVIYILACTFAMLLPTHKLFWFVNLVSALPQIGTILLCALQLKNERDVQTDCLPIFMLVQLVIAFMYWLETMMQGLQTMYGDDSLSYGIIIAEAFGLILIIVWCILAYETKVHSEQNMSGEKREKFIQSRKTKIARVNINRN